MIFNNFNNLSYVNFAFSSMDPVIFNIIEVLCVLLPMLLCVAFVTIQERKQLAAMQRRVGPDTVGLRKQRNFKDSCASHTFLTNGQIQKKRFYHNTSNINSQNDYINDFFFLF